MANVMTGIQLLEYLQAQTKEQLQEPISVYNKENDEFYSLNTISHVTDDLLQDESDGIIDEGFILQYGILDTDQ